MKPLPMRLAIAGCFSLSGKQTMAVRALPLAAELAARGHSVLMALPLRAIDEKPGSPAAGGVSIRYFPRAGWLPERLAEPAQALRMAVACLRWRPTVLYVFKPIAHSWVVLFVFWLLRRLTFYRGALVLDTDDWEGKGGWNDRQPFSPWVKRLIGWQEGWSLAHADLVTVASRTLEEMAASRASRRPLYLPNAVAASSAGLLAPRGMVSRASLGLRRDQPVVLAYTRFVEFSPHRMLRALEAIRELEPSAVLLVVGTGLAGEDAVFEKVAKEKGLWPNIRVAGWVGSDALPDYFALADVALYLLDDTLLNRAKCPMKLLDLMAAGVAVVADGVGQAKEYLEDGGSGVVVSPEDTEAMAAAAVRLLKNAEERTAMGERAARAARTAWSWSRWASAVEKALLQVEEDAISPVGRP